MFYPFATMAGAVDKQFFNLCIQEIEENLGSQGNLNRFLAKHLNGNNRLDCLGTYIKNFYPFLSFSSGDTKVILKSPQ